jgi:hypothetical protein
VQAHQVAAVRRPAGRERASGGGCVGRQEGRDAFRPPAHVHAAAAATLSESLAVHDGNYIRWRRFEQPAMQTGHKVVGFALSAVIISKILFTDSGRDFFKGPVDHENNRV